jgi:S-adenosyl-L-methionine hydrolase (adenosine-forming)
VSIITLTTDFGLADGYVGTMKGVILGIDPTVIIVDISHDISPPSPHPPVPPNFGGAGGRGVREAAYVLYAACPYFPQDTVHVVVVDPGVGSERRAIALRTPQAAFVAPDNGVLSYVVAVERVEEIVHLTNPRYHLSPVSRTFHGRDVFAPVAAHLARGIPLAELGQPLTEIVTFPLPRPQFRPDGAIVGQVIHVDRFGNLITSIMSKDWADSSPQVESVVKIKGRRIRGIVNTYAEVTAGKLLALIGSEGHLEISVSGGSASQTLRAKVGDEILLKVEGREDRR